MEPLEYGEELVLKDEEWSEGWLFRLWASRTFEGEYRVAATLSKEGGPTFALGVSFASEEEYAGGDATAYALIFASRRKHEELTSGTRADSDEQSRRCAEARQDFLREAREHDCGEPIRVTISPEVVAAANRHVEGIGGDDESAAYASILEIGRGLAMAAIYRNGHLGKEIILTAETQKK